jgi:hypothetical protein
MTADTFLDKVSASAIHDQDERNELMSVYTALNIAAPAEAERVLPSILQHVRVGNEILVREYASQFLLGIVLRPDGATILLPKSDEISALIVDDDAVIQRTAVTVVDYVVGRTRAANTSYESSLMAAIQNAHTPQDNAVEMITPLMMLGYLASKDPRATQAVLNFLHRDDLSVDTRTGILHGTSTFYDTSGEITAYLCKSFDNPNPRVRAAAVIAFANSAGIPSDPRTEAPFHRLAKSRVERMANDADENPQVRELAKRALAGQGGLNPNIDMPPENAKDH